MSTSLFDDFDAISAKQWKQKIQFELNGKDYNESLVYATLEDINIKPFYTKENVDPKLQVPTPSNLWKNNVIINASHAKTANTKALESIQQGAESIHFTITEITIQPSILLSKIPKEVPIYITTSFLDSNYIESISNNATQQGLTCYIVTDTIGTLCRTGSWHTHAKEDAMHLEAIAELTPTLQSSCAVDMSTYQNAGATMVQQLAYGLAHANEYLNYFNTKKRTSPFIHSPIVFTVAIGGNYFFEIAKLRALRVLWKTLSNAYHVKEECHIIATPSLRNKTIVEANMNMIRTTTECMSAILGGADTICNQRYDVLFKDDNDFASRRALHQLLILKHESDCDPTQHPTTGTYYIESLTKQLAEKALLLFKNIEKSGGLLHQVTTGTLQKKIKENAEKEQSLFDSNTITLTGINTHQPIQYDIPNIQKSLFTTPKRRKTMINPIPIRRLAEKIDVKTIKNLNI